MTSVLAVVVALIVVFWTYRHVSRAREVARAWAVAQGYEVEKFLCTAHSISPFPIQSLGKQAIRRVRLRDRLGSRRVAWLLIGDPVVGLLDDQVHEVSWER